MFFYSLVLEEKIVVGYNGVSINVYCLNNLKILYDDLSLSSYTLLSVS